MVIDALPAIMAAVETAAMAAVETPEAAPAAAPVTAATAAILRARKLSTVMDLTVMGAIVAIHLQVLVAIPLANHLHMGCGVLQISLLLTLRRVVRQKILSYSDKEVATQAALQIQPLVAASAIPAQMALPATMAPLLVLRAAASLPVPRSKSPLALALPDPTAVAILLLLRGPTPLLVPPGGKTRLLGFGGILTQLLALFLDLIRQDDDLSIVRTLSSWHWMVVTRYI